MTTKPIHRTFTTLCPAIDPEVVGQSLYPGGPPMQQNLLLLWGKEKDHLIVDDCWIFSVKDMRWNKVCMYVHACDNLDSSLISQF